MISVAEETGRPVTWLMLQNLADPDDFHMDHALWEDEVWPALYNRAEGFGEAKLVRMWAGHYAFNTLDQNAIIGRNPQVPNLYHANGFSGHGLQQAPAVGRGIAEWIATGRYETLVHVGRRGGVPMLTFTSMLLDPSSGSNSSRYSPIG